MVDWYLRWVDDLIVRRSFLLVLTGHAGRVAPISPMLKRRISCGLEILN